MGQIMGDSCPSHPIPPGFDWGKYVGLPYLHNGRSTEGVDCLGLVEMIYRDLGIPFRSSDGRFIPEKWYEEEPRRFWDGLKSQGQEPKGKLQAGDLVYFEIVKGVVSHAGIMVDGENFIHILEGGTSRIDPIGRRFWKSKFAGARRLI